MLLIMNCLDRSATSDASGALSLTSPTGSATKPQLQRSSSSLPALLSFSSPSLLHRVLVFAASLCESLTTASSMGNKPLWDLHRVFSSSLGKAPLLTPAASQSSSRNASSLRSMRSPSSLFRVTLQRAVGLWSNIDLEASDARRKWARWPWKRIAHKDLRRLSSERIHVRLATPSLPMVLLRSVFRERECETER